MTGHCTCLPDPECPEHGLDRGLNVRVESRDVVGGCEFCPRPHTKVYRVVGVGTHASARFCPSCWLELVLELPPKPAVEMAAMPPFKPERG